MILVVRDLWDITQIKREGTQEDERNSEKAKAIICLNLHDSQIGYVRHAKTARDAWNSLVNVHESKGLIRKLQLRRDFFSVQKRDDESVQKYVDRCQLLYDQLAAIGSNLSDEDIVLMILTGLPASYAPLIMALETRTETLRTAVVIPLLLDEERRRTETERSGEALAMYHKGARPSRQETSHTNRKGACHNCGKSGHWARECRKPKTEKAHLTQYQAKEYSFSARVEERQREVVKVATASNLDSSTWVLDSGAYQAHDLPRGMDDQYGARQYTD